MLPKKLACCNDCGIAGEPPTISDYWVIAEAGDRYEELEQYCAECAELRRCVAASMRPADGPPIHDCEDYIPDFSASFGFMPIEGECYVCRNDAYPQPEPEPED